MAQQLLDRDKINTALLVVGGASPPQRMRAEPDDRWPAFQLHQVTQPVPDRASVQSARMTGDHRPSRTIRRATFFTRRKSRWTPRKALHQLE
jgi:hypothetical protein